MNDRSDSKSGTDPSVDLIVIQVGDLVRGWLGITGVVSVVLDTPDGRRCRYGNGFWAFDWALERVG